MDAITAIYQRRAVRNYLEGFPPHQALAGLIDAAIQAPTAMDRQPWAFVVATGRSALARHSDRAKAYLLSTMQPDGPLASMRPMLESEAFNIFYGAPALIVVCATDEDAMSATDCCLAAENLMIAASAEGLGSCWIGLAEPWLRSPEGRAALGVPVGHAVIAPIIVGLPAEHPHAPPRHPPKIHWVEPAPVPAEAGS